MHDVMEFHNEALGLQIRTILNEDGSISMNMEDTARGFGFTTIAKSGNTVVRWNTVHKYLCDFGVATSCNDGNYREMCPDYIPESLFYLLGMKASNKSSAGISKMAGHGRNTYYPQNRRLHNAAQAGLQLSLCK